MTLIHKLASIAVASVLSAAAYADVAPTDAANSNLQTTLQQLQAQVDALKAAADAKDNQLILRPQMAQASQVLNNGYAHLAMAKGVLFESLPSPTFALAVVQNRSKFGDQDMLYGGYLEQDAQYWSGDQIPAKNNNNANYTYQNGTGMYLTTAKLDNLLLINPWVSTFISFAGTNLTSSTADLAVAKAFVLVGNMQYSPLYGIVGQNYLPFGAFAGGGPWTSPLTKSYFRPNETMQGMLGYYQNGLNTSFAIFNNASNTNPKDQVSDFTYDLAYAGQINSAITYSVGAGYLNDLRSTSAGIASEAGNINGRLPGYDINASLGYGMYALSGEYDWTNSQIAGNLSTAKGWNLTGSYTPTLWDEQTSFALSYSGTSGLNNVAVGLSADLNNAPTVTAGAKSSWVASATREVIHNVFLGLEYATIYTYQNQYTQATTLDISVYF